MELGGFFIIHWVVMRVYSGIVGIERYLENNCGYIEVNDSLGKLTNNILTIPLFAL
jgi:hypothetical protein